MSFKFLTIVLLIGLFTLNVKAQDKKTDEIKKEAEDMKKFLNEYSKSLKTKKRKSGSASSNDLDSMFSNSDFSIQLDSIKYEIRELNKKMDNLIPLLKEAYNSRATSPDQRIKIADKTLGKCNCVRVYFPFNSDEFDRSDTKSLDSLSSILKANKKLRLRIDGHSDKIGAQGPNELISKKRAQSVYTYFVKEKGIIPESITIDWLGNTRPHINTTDVDFLWLNRRAEIFVE